MTCTVCSADHPGMRHLTRAALAATKTATLPAADRAMLDSAKFRRSIEQPFRVDRTHDVPYVAGYSKDGSTVYVDRHLPVTEHGHNIEPYLLLHERVEKCLIDDFGLKYQRAHGIAEKVEKEAVMHSELLLSEYNAHYTRWIKGLVKEKLKNPPRDLDLTPYQDEHSALAKKLLAFE